MGLLLVGCEAELSPKEETPNRVEDTVESDSEALAASAGTSAAVSGRTAKVDTSAASNSTERAAGELPGAGSAQRKAGVDRALAGAARAAAPLAAAATGKPNPIPQNGYVRTPTELAEYLARYSAEYDPKNPFDAGLKSRAMLETASVIDSKVSVGSANLADVPSWNYADIVSMFRQVRDARYMHAPGDANFVRRPTWMFPENGCWIRAELMAISAEEAGLVRPYKVWAFANSGQRLDVVSTNADPSSTHPGHVWWRYHVVPIVKSLASGTAYVLDPAIEPSGPLTWTDWLYRMVTDLNILQVTISDSNAYDPGSQVTGATPVDKLTAVTDMQNGFMDAEWYRQETQLGRDAVTLLGNYPPWANVGRDFDRDAKSDLIYFNPRSLRTEVWYMDNTSRTNLVAFNYNLGAGWQMVGSGDFDRDGSTDAVWHNGSTGATRICTMSGTSRNSCAELDTRYPVPDSSGWTFAGTGDFNYDGRPDIVWRHLESGTHQAWFVNDSLTLLTWQNLSANVPISSGWTYVATADFNRDGKDDVLWHHSDGRNYVWYMDGTYWTGNGGDTSIPSAPESSGWRPVQVSDSNYDKRPDILWRNTSDGRQDQWYMDGLTYTSTGILPRSNSTWTIVPGND